MMTGIPAANPNIPTLVTNTIKAIRREHKVFLYRSINNASNGIHNNKQIEEYLHSNQQVIMFGYPEKTVSAQTDNENE